MSTTTGIENKTKVFVENDSTAWESVGEGLRRKIMAFEEKMMMVRVEFEVGAVGTVHKHYHVQMTSVESGVFEVEIEGKKKILKGGDVIYIPANVLHGAVCLEAGVLIDVFSPMREDFFPTV